jgi:hypothetical protein
LVWLDNPNFTAKWTKEGNVGDFLEELFDGAEFAFSKGRKTVGCLGGSANSLSPPFFGKI